MKQLGKQIAPADKVTKFPTIRMLPAVGSPSAAILLPFLTEAARRAGVDSLTGKKRR